MEQYPIYPVKGKAAREYLFIQGCSVGPDMICLPDHLQVLPTQHNGTLYAVMHTVGKVFTMQYYPTNRWRVIVPRHHRVGFAELLCSYHIDDLLATYIFGHHTPLRQLLTDAPVSVALAQAVLQRLSEYTGHPYDVENVRVVVEQTEGAGVKR